jgi:hypothetical protein
MSRFVRIPRQLLHVRLDDLRDLGVPTSTCTALRALLADLPLVPTAADNAQVIGPPEVVVPSLAVLARHVGQGLRDHNLMLAHDRHTLRERRRKLAFVDAESLVEGLCDGDQGPADVAVLFVANANSAVLPLLEQREANNLASFIGIDTPLQALGHWRSV